jgi:hypothetical protein
MSTESSALGGDFEAMEDAAPAENTEQQEQQEYSGPEWAKDLEIESDLLGDPSLKAIKDVPTLVKSYVHAQRKIGSDKTIIPDKNSTQEEINQFYAKLGLPEFEQYDFARPEKDAADDSFRDGFKQLAHENKLLPHQAEAMYNFISEQALERSETMQANQSEAIENAMNDLKQSWGEQFDSELRMAKLAVKEFGGDEFINYLNESGLGNNAQLIKLMNTVGKQFFKEDKFNAESKPAYANSPAEAQEKVNKIMGDYNGPYYNKSHPDHARIVKEVEKMYQVMSASKGA